MTILSAKCDLVICLYTGAIPVTEGHFNSPSLPLLPTSTVFQCNGSEDNLSMCISESDATTSECIRGAAGVVCQGQNTCNSDRSMYIYIAYD